MSMLGLALALLVLFLAAARAGDRARARLGRQAWNDVLSPSGRETLDQLHLAVEEHRIGIRMLDRATQARDAARLRRAIGVIEDFAPGLEAGLFEVRNMSRVVRALAPLPPVWPWAWRAWRLRGLAGLALVTHAVLVTAAERIRLRASLLACALGMCIASLRQSSARVERRAAEWRQVETALHDLQVVGGEADATYRHVVQALDRVGTFAEA